MAAPNMNDRTLVQLLSVLSKSERKKFKTYLQGSEQNSKSLLLAVLIVLDRWISGSRKKPLQAESVCEKVGIAASTLEKSLSQILSLLRGFIREETLRKNSLRDYGYALDYWFFKSLNPKSLAGEFRYYNKKIDELPESISRLMLKLNLQDRATQIQVQLPRKRGSRHFSKYLLHLEEFYLTARLKYTCAEINSWKILGGEKPECETEGLLDRFQSMGGELRGLGRAYLNTLAILKDDVPVLGKVRSQLGFMEETYQNISAEDNADLYGFLLNSAIRALDIGQESSLDMVFEIYDAMLRNGMLVESDIIKGWHFSNYVSITLLSGRIEKARDFIEHYQQFLPPWEKTTVLPICLGKVGLYARNFRYVIKTIQAFVESASEDSLWEIEARSMLWIAYFGAYDSLNLGEHDELLKFYDAFRVSISRNEKVAPRVIVRYTNFCRLFNKLVRMKSAQEMKGARLQSLLEEIISTEPMPHKSLVIDIIRREMES